MPTYARYFLSGVLAFGIHTSVKRINDDILTKEVGPFVTCLSEARDELSQWRGYAGDGGYAIGFDRERLAKSIKPKPRKGSPPPQTGQSLRFGPVELHMSRLVKMKYDLADEKTIDQEINDALAGLISHLERRADSSAEGPDESMTSLMNRILAIMTERKDPAFEAEREHRIITFEYPDPNMFHPKPSIGLIPRVAVEFGPESVREILVGPGGDSELRKFSVTYFVKHDPHYSHVEVKRSRVPFRTP